MYYQGTDRSRQIGEKLLTSASQLFATLDHKIADSGMTLHLFPRAEAGSSATDIEGFSWQGVREFYPASVIKVAYLAAAQAAISDGTITPHAELARAMTDMIRWSSNNATNYVIDLLSGTTGDTLLPESQMRQWFEQRQGVNRFFRQLGWPEAETINVCQKLMDDDRYGREKVFVTLDGKNNHNCLNADFVARLISEICKGRFRNIAVSREIANYLKRPLTTEFKSQPHSQIDGFLGEQLPLGLEYYSKAGWNGWTGDALSSYNRHDSAHFTLPQDHCKAFGAVTFVIFSHGKTVSGNTDFLPRIGKDLFEILGQY